MKLLSKPYPYSAHSPSKIRIVFLSGLFIGLFMFLFQPFGLNNLQMSHKSLFMFGYGAVTMLILAFCLFVLPKLISGYFCEKYWTVGREIFFMLVIVFLIGLGNYFYSAIFFRITDNWVLGVLSFQGFTLLIGIFPITGIIVYSHNKYLQKNLKEAKLVNAGIDDEGVYKTEDRSDKKIFLSSVNQSDEPVEVLLNDFLFIQSEGNYLEAYFFDAGKPQHRLIRNTLLNAEKMLQEFFPPLMRCHRSYIVNLEQIEKVNGNAQGLLLKMKNCEEKVPVSRKYIEELKINFSN